MTKFAVKSFEELQAAVRSGALQVRKRVKLANPPKPAEKRGPKPLSPTQEICAALTEGRELLVIDDNHASWRTREGAIAVNVHGKIVEFENFALLAESSAAVSLLAKRRRSMSMSNAGDCCLRAAVKHAKHHMGSAELPMMLL